MDPTSEARSHGRESWASLLLIGTTVFWGLSFPLMKNWQDARGGCPGGAVVAAQTAILLRMAFALALFAAFRPGLFRAPAWRAHAVGALVGFMNFLGFSLQVVGLDTTTPARSGFLTSLCSAWVPLFAWMMFRTRVRPATLVGLGVGLSGAAFLSVGEEFGWLQPVTGGAVKAAATWSLGVGDGLTFLSSFFFAVAVVLLDRLGRTVPSGHLTVGFIAATGLGAALVAAVWLPTSAAISGGEGSYRAWMAWTAGQLGQPVLLRDVVLLTLFCTVIPFHWMTVYQPRVSASRAALIYLLEPVFAALFSLAFGLDQVTPYLLVGGGLILGGNLLVELPAWLRERAARLAREEPRPDNSLDGVVGRNGHTERAGHDGAARRYEGVPPGPA